VVEVVPNGVGNRADFEGNGWAGEGAVQKLVLEPTM
jgi:hypothetical protein